MVNENINAIFTDLILNAILFVLQNKQPCSGISYTPRSERVATSVQSQPAAYRQDIHQSNPVSGQIPNRL